KFSTYAYNWIVQRITRYFGDYGRSIRLPIHLWEKISMVQKAKTKFYDNLHREPTANELAEELKCKVSTIERLLILDSPIISLDSLFSYSDLVDFRLVPPNPVLENDKSAKYYLGDYYYNESETDEFCARIDQKDMIKKLFTHLNEKQADVLIRRYGLDKRPEETLEQIGLKYNVTRERIRQIEDRALKKLRLHIKAHQ
ncbi:MAG: sigma-70 family RNA polymerase sigma factor, partial [Bacilli bacterium]|nr:sigma-70 family RNA polymerase sigma factor [Bacilli bacterium]